MHLRAGDSLTVATEYALDETSSEKEEYALDETSSEKEEYAFTLRCQVGHLRSPDNPEVLDPVGVRWDDRRGRHDKHAGQLEKTITFGEAGEFAIGWEVEAEYRKLPWGEHAITSTDRKSTGGRIYVHVE